MGQRDAFDYIIIETTGLANPGPVAEALWTDAELESMVCLDAIVTVVDAKHIMRHLHEPRPCGAVNEAQQQVAYADVILLNKIDLVSQGELMQLEQDITTINAEASVIPCDHCVVDLRRILNTGLYAEAIAVERTTELFNDDSPPPLDLGGMGCHGLRNMVQNSAEDDACDGGCAGNCAVHRHHHHDVHSVAVHVQRPLCLEKVRHWLDELLWGPQRGDSKGTEESEVSMLMEDQGKSFDGRERETATAASIVDVSAGGSFSSGVFRMKGLLHVHGSSKKWVLQGVHELYDIFEGPAWPVDARDRRSKIVFIGRRLKEKDLMEGFYRCCID